MPPSLQTQLFNLQWVRIQLSSRTVLAVANDSVSALLVKFSCHSYHSVCLQENIGLFKIIKVHNQIEIYSRNMHIKTTYFSIENASFDCPFLWSITQKMYLQESFFNVHNVEQPLKQSLGYFFSECQKHRSVYGRRSFLSKESDNLRSYRVHISPTMQASSALIQIEAQKYLQRVINVL